MGRQVREEFTARKARGRYENWLVLMAFATTGWVFLDRFAIQYLAPLFVPEFHMSSAQVGLAIGVLSLTVGLSGWIFGAFSDRRGRRLVLIPATVMFSVLSVVTGLVQSFGQLIIARLLMGASDGAVLTPLFGTVAQESTPSRRGLNVGTAQSAIGLIGVALSPVIVTQLGYAFGWRWAFALVAIPGLVTAVFLWRFLREPAREARSGGGPTKAGLFEVMRYRNVRLSAITGFCFGTWTVCFSAFLPLFLTGPVYHLAFTSMGALLGAWGLVNFVSFISVPFFSDRLGRKPTVIVSSLCLAATALLVPMGLPIGVLGVLVAVLLLFSGGTPVAMIVIPTEAAPAALAASAVAVPGFTLEVFGSFISPAVAGALADALHQPAVPFYIAALAAILAAATSLLYRETAPKRVGAKKTAAAPVTA